MPQNNRGRQPDDGTRPRQSAGCLRDETGQAKIDASIFKAIAIAIAISISIPTKTFDLPERKRRTRVKAAATAHNEEVVFWWMVMGAVVGLPCRTLPLYFYLSA